MNTCSRYCVSTALVNVLGNTYGIYTAMRHRRYNKWLQFLSLPNQELHSSEVSFKHDFVCNVLKLSPLYPGKLSPRPKIERQRARTSVVAYADDVTIFVTAPTDIRKLQEAIHCYEAAPGARVNIKNHGQ
jgi:hypothetical protein